MAAVMTSFLSQHRSYLAQDDMVEMQQNFRVAMDMLTRDIRTAGYDPNDLGDAITTAGANDVSLAKMIATAKLGNSFLRFILCFYY